MSGQQRRISLVVGVVFLAVFAWSLPVSLGVVGDATPETTAVVLAGGAAVLLGGVAFLIAGLRARVSIGGRTVEWWEFQSVGFVCLGLYMAISALAQGSPTSLFALASLAAGSAFAIFGVQRLRTGLPEESEPTTRQVATIVVGTVAAVLLIGLAMVLLG